ncbi:MAG TPA: methylated-DNA--[protein]-cysteine S-methyltransferase [Candidatus Binataceae bacterium]|jgi:methylated-DNA-[protein]-cysteine S-methyltransferase
MNHKAATDREAGRVTVDDRGMEIDKMVREAHSGIAFAMKTLRRPAARVGVVASPVGRLLVAESDRGLAAIHFMAVSDSERMLTALRQRFDLIENEPATEKISRALGRYFAGDYTVLEHPVDMSLVESDFKRRAYARLRTVPIGSVITYQGLAAAVGAPDGQRAIGNTMATNPVPIFVPCHRVIRSDGSIGNYGGGVERKLLLLRTEGFVVGRDLRVPEGAVLGHRRTHIFCRENCSAAQRADHSNLLIFADSEHARRAGLRPCRLCAPA